MYHRPCPLASVHSVFCYLSGSIISEEPDTLSVWIHYFRRTRYTVCLDPLFQKNQIHCLSGSIISEEPDTLSVWIHYFRRTRYTVCLDPLFQKNQIHCLSGSIISEEPDTHNDIMSHGMRFPTMWYVRPAKAQTSLRMRAV